MPHNRAHASATRSAHFCDAISCVLQYEALGPLKARGPKENSLCPFKPSHAGRSSAFSAQPEYMACPVPKASSAQVSALVIWLFLHLL